MTANTAETFWERVDRSGGPEACWPWTGYTGRKGYGQISLRLVAGQTRTLAHRAAWLLTHGTLADGLCVCHACDNPPCCNPAHLFLGTIADNNRDMGAKGRNRGGQLVHSHPGERHPRAKISDAQAQEIRRRFAAGETRASLARRFGLKSWHAVERIVDGSGWRHLGPAPDVRHPSHRVVTHCPQGHPYDEANTYRAARGDRQCRACRRARRLARRVSA